MSTFSTIRTPLPSPTGAVAYTGQGLMRLLIAVPHNANAARVHFVARNAFSLAGENSVTGLFVLAGQTVDLTNREQIDGFYTLQEGPIVVQFFTGSVGSTL